MKIICNSDDTQRTALSTQKTLSNRKGKDNPMDKT